MQKGLSSTCETSTTTVSLETTKVSVQTSSTFSFFAGMSGRGELDLLAAGGPMVGGGVWLAGTGVRQGRGWTPGGFGPSTPAPSAFGWPSTWNTVMGPGLK